MISCVNIYINWTTEVVFSWINVQLFVRFARYRILVVAVSCNSQSGTLIFREYHDLDHALKKKIIWHWYCGKKQIQCDSVLALSVLLSTTTCVISEVKVRFLKCKIHLLAIRIVGFVYLFLLWLTFIFTFKTSKDIFLALAKIGMKIAKIKNTNIFIFNNIHEQISPFWLVKSSAILLVFEKLTRAYLFQIALVFVWLPLQIVWETCEPNQRILGYLWSKFLQTENFIRRYSEIPRNKSVFLLSSSNHHYKRP